MASPMGISDQGHFLDWRVDIRRVDNCLRGSNDSTRAFLLLRSWVWRSHKLAQYETLKIPIYQYGVTPVKNLMFILSGLPVVFVLLFFRTQIVEVSGNLIWLIIFYLFAIIYLVIGGLGLIRVLRKIWGHDI